MEKFERLCSIILLARPSRTFDVRVRRGDENARTNAASSCEYIKKFH